MGGTAGEERRIEPQDIDCASTAPDDRDIMGNADEHFPIQPHRVETTVAIGPVFTQDGSAVEAEQRGYEAHFDAPVIEVNPVVGLFHELTIRKWEEHLSGARLAEVSASAP